MRRMLFLLIGLALIATACGDSGGDDGESRDVIVEQVKAGILEAAGEDDGFSISDAEAQCVSEDVVDELGVGGVVALGISAEDSGDNPFADATDEQVGAVVDAMLSCVDFKAAILPEIQADGISEDSANCVVDEMLGADFFRPAIVEAMRGSDFDLADDPDAAGAMVEIVFGCLTPEELAELGG